ncbi:hypothetical protein ACUNWD_05855 [Sunxiuqinia sp. A32]|uniref:hypothetical protein n=1 Tax=Sunxiuqinia sp. A32 TaxID=3461496 RepID=UPI004045C3D4
MKNQFQKVTLVLVVLVAFLTSIQAKNATEFSFDLASDPVLEIEEWMVQDEYWTSSFEVAPDEVDQELNLEQWMVEDCYWK